jgi:VWFA-related protein
MRRLIQLFAVVSITVLLAIGISTAQNQSPDQPQSDQPQSDHPQSNPPQQNAPQPQLQPRPAPPAVPPAPPAERQIQLDVQVNDKSGTPVQGLRQEDFTLLDDKRPQSLLSFHAVDGETSRDPVEVVIVIDAVNVGFQTVGYERGEVRKFLLQDGGKLPVPTTLIFFTDSGAQMQPSASQDGNHLATVFDQFETGLRNITRSQGFYGAAERFDLSLKTLDQLIKYEKSRPGRKLVVWFSPGWPLLSGPNVQLSRKDTDHFFDAIVADSNDLRQARMTLYSVDPLGLADVGGVRISYYEEFLKGISKPDRSQAADLSLQVLSVQSGGRVLNGSNDLSQELATAVSDARAFYVMSFAAARADHPNEYHAIEVKVDKPGAKARTRTGYYAQP